MDKREPKNPVSAQLSRAIKKHGHTQEQVGQILGVSSSTVSSMIHGKAVKTLTSIMSKVRQYINLDSMLKDYGNIFYITNNGAVTPELEEVKPSIPSYSKEVREFTKIHYIRDDNYKPIGCLVAKLVSTSNDVNSPFFVAIGLSQCNTEHDSFNKKIGRELAIARANVYWKESKFVNRQISEYRDTCIELINFVASCTRYYRNKSIIMPKIYFTN